MNQFELGSMMSSLVKKEDAGGSSGVPKDSTTKRGKGKVVDFELAHRFEDSRLIRELVRENGRLIRWLSEKHVNIINLETLGLNSTLMKLVVDYHCSGTKVIKAPGIDFLKAQVRNYSQIVLNQTF